MNLINFLKNNTNTRKIFGEGELIIIEKQLLGVNLTQSEKNRLSRDIRKKFDFIRDLSLHEFNLELKKGEIINNIVKESKKIIESSSYNKNIKRIILFGSTVDNSRRLGSDIDIATEFYDINNKDAIKFRLELSKQLNELIDLQVYNTLPLKIKENIDEKGREL